MSEIAVPQATAIIPFRGDQDGFRTRNLGVVLRWLAEAGLPAVVVEHSDSPAAGLELPPGVTRIHLPAQRSPFNKAAACNAGFRAVSSPVIALVDADTFVGTAALLHAVAAVNEDLDAVRPFGSLVELSETETAAIAAGGPWPESARGQHDDNRAGERIPLCGGLVVVRTDAYAEAGGMDESFRGWGGEDDALSMALMRTGKQCAIIESAVAFHLDHPRSMESRYGHPHYANNLARAQWWHGAPVEEITAHALQARQRLTSKG